LALSATFVCRTILCICFELCAARLPSHCVHFLGSNNTLSLLVLLPRCELWARRFPSQNQIVIALFVLFPQHGAAVLRLRHFLCNLMIIVPCMAASWRRMKSIAAILLVPLWCRRSACRSFATVVYPKRQPYCSLLANVSTVHTLEMHRRLVQRQWTLVHPSKTYVRVFHNVMVRINKRRANVARSRGCRAVIWFLDIKRQIVAKRADCNPIPVQGSPQTDFNEGLPTAFRSALIQRFLVCKSLAEDSNPFQ
jgi:hypothetical protein